MFQSRRPTTYYITIEYHKIFNYTVSSTKNKYLIRILVKSGTELFWPKVYMHEVALSIAYDLAFFSILISY